jgi:hypothetical protein
VIIIVLVIVFIVSRKGGGGSTYNDSPTGPNYEHQPMSLYARFTTDLRDYSVFVPPPGVPTKSVLREHGDGIVSFRMTESDRGWLFFDIRSDDLVFHLSAPADVDDATMAFLRGLSSTLIEGVSEKTPVMVHAEKRVGQFRTDCAAVIHPSVARVCPVPKAIYAMPSIYRVMPCYRCEFTVDDRPEEATWRILRVIKGGWMRDPHPAIQMRFAVTATGVKSTGGKKLGVFELPRVIAILDDVKKGDGFAEVENWERRKVTLTSDSGRWTLSEKKGKTIDLSEDELSPWLQAFTTQSADAAARVIVR